MRGDGLQRQNAFDRSERAIWSGSAAAYAATFAAVCAYPVPTLLDAVGVRTGERLLDVGTGTGVVAEAAVARGATVTAVDAEPSMALAARARVPQADVLQAVLPGLPVEAGAFDVAVANFVVNHVGRPRDAVAELRRVVRPGGRVGVTLWPAAPPDGQTSPSGRSGRRGCGGRTTGGRGSWGASAATATSSPSQDAATIARIRGASTS